MSKEQLTDRLKHEALWDAICKLNQITDKVNYLLERVDGGDSKIREATPPPPMPGLSDLLNGVGVGVIDSDVETVIELLNKLESYLF